MSIEIEHLIYARITEASSDIKALHTLRFWLWIVSWYDRGMAHLPARTNESRELDQPSRNELSIAEHLSKGRSPLDIARLAYPDDKRKRRALKRRIERLILRSPHIERLVHQKAKLTLLSGVAPVAESLVGRAKATGKADVVRLAFESSGFHNPRVDHHHDGDINITLSIPRPHDTAALPNSEADENVVDAEVIEDE